MKTILFIALGFFTLSYLWIWISEMRTHPVDPGKKRRPGWIDSGIGFITNFFDTLGVGSFATTTSLFRFAQTVRDEQIPGTLNVGHTLPTVAEVLIYVAIVQVDPVTLFAMIGASAIGAWLGAGIVARWPRRNIQIGMGIALLVAAGFFLNSQFNSSPTGGMALGVTGTKLAIAVGVNMMLGALMTLGIGLYGPCMILVASLGMNPKAAFPIMMGSCAFLMPVASARFVRERSYNLKAALGLAIGGVPGVLLAAYIVKELPLYWVKWLVICVVVYTATMMLRSAHFERTRKVAAVPAAR